MISAPASQDGESSSSGVLEAAEEARAPPQIARFKAIATRSICMGLEEAPEG